MSENNDEMQHLGPDFKIYVWFGDAVLVKRTARSSVTLVGGRGVRIIATSLVAVQTREEANRRVE